MVDVMSFLLGVDLLLTMLHLPEFLQRGVRHIGRTIPLADLGTQICLGHRLALQQGDLM